MARKTTYTYLDDPNVEPGVVRFAKEEIAEGKKVEWPNRETVRKLTIVVLVLTAVMSLLLGGLDLGLTLLYGFFRNVFGV
jgi:preprotein translocase subunit SecE